MRMRGILVTLLATSLAGCSSGTSGLTTGSLFGGSQANVAAPTPPAQKPEDRTSRVASIVARAQKCGYNFDAQRLKDGYFAYESSAGVAPEQLAGITRLYEATHRTTLERLRADDDYCSDSVTRDIKSDLTRYLAGDFSLPQKAQVATGGWFDSAGPRKREVLDPEWMRDMRNNNKTKPVE